MRTSYAVAAGLVVLLVAGLAVALVGRARADGACTTEAERLGATSVTQSWSWAPPGTTCRFDGGPGGEQAQTRLLW